MAGNEKKQMKEITAEEFDRKLEAGEDVSEYFDFSKATKRVNLDLPLQMLKDLDSEADRIGIPRQALIKVWLSERLDQLKMQANGSFAQPVKTREATRKALSALTPEETLMVAKRVKRLRRLQTHQSKAMAGAKVRAKR